jgi:hypothetical protein
MASQLNYWRTARFLLRATREQWATPCSRMDRFPLPAIPVQWVIPSTVRSLRHATPARWAIRCQRNFGSFELAIGLQELNTGAR